MNTVPLFLTAGYKKRVCDGHPHPTVMLFGAYKTKREARQRQAALCGLGTLPAAHGSVMCGRGYTTWIKRITMGDMISCNVSAAFENLGESSSAPDSEPNVNTTRERGSGVCE